MLDHRGSLEHARKSNGAGVVVEDAALPVSSVLGAFSEYLELGRSHKCYWDNVETMACMLKFIALGVERHNAVSTLLT
jgi:hypothetical protein